MAADHHVGDTSALTFYVKGRSGSAYNLTGATITLRIRRPGGDVLSVSGSIVSASAGTFSYTTLTTTFNTKGTYRFQAKIVISGTTLYTDFPEREILDNLL